MRHATYAGVIMCVWIGVGSGVDLWVDVNGVDVRRVCVCCVRMFRFCFRVLMCGWVFELEQLAPCSLHTCVSWRVNTRDMTHRWWQRSRSFARTFPRLMNYRAALAVAVIQGSVTGEEGTEEEKEEETEKEKEAPRHMWENRLVLFSCCWSMVPRCDSLPLGPGVHMRMLYFSRVGGRVCVGMCAARACAWTLVTHEVWLVFCSTCLCHGSRPSGSARKEERENQGGLEGGSTSSHDFKAGALLLWEETANRRAEAKGGGEKKVGAEENARGGKSGQKKGCIHTFELSSYNFVCLSMVSSQDCVFKVWNPCCDFEFVLHWECYHPLHTRKRNCDATCPQKWFVLMQFSLAALHLSLYHTLRISWRNSSETRSWFPRINAPKYYYIPEPRKRLCHAQGLPSSPWSRCGRVLAHALSHSVFHAGHEVWPPCNRLLISLNPVASVNDQSWLSLTAAGDCRQASKKAEHVSFDPRWASLLRAGPPRHW